MARARDRDERYNVDGCWIVMHDVEVESTLYLVVQGEPLYAYSCVNDDCNGNRGHINV